MVNKPAESWRHTNRLLTDRQYVGHSSCCPWANNTAYEHAPYTIPHPNVTRRAANAVTASPLPLTQGVSGRSSIHTVNALKGNNNNRRYSDSTCLPASHVTVFSDHVITSINSTPGLLPNSYCGGRGIRWLSIILTLTLTPTAPMSTPTSSSSPTVTHKNKSRRQLNARHLSYCSLTVVTLHEYNVDLARILWGTHGERRWLVGAECGGIWGGVSLPSRLGV